jgi:hypothetical protein
MRRAVALFAVAVMLLVMPPVRADIVVSSDQGRLEGTLQDATFHVSGFRRIYVRSQIQAVELSDDGHDTLTLSSGRKVEGRVLSVTFKAAAGLYAFARSKLKSIALDSTVAPEVEEPREEPRARPTLSAEEVEAQKKALAINAQLHKGFSAKVTVRHSAEMQAVKRRHMKACAQVFDKLDPLEQRVKDKLRRRQEAKRDRARYRSLIQSDRLEADQRALAEARREKDKLRGAIEGEMGKVDGRAEGRKRRIGAAAKGVESELLAGQLLTEVQMVRRYEAALTGLSAEERAKRIKIRTMDSGVKVRPGPDKDTPELIVDPFPEEG